MSRFLVLAAMLFAAAPAMAKDAVAVLYFAYEGKDPEMSALKVGLAQMMITDLSGHDAYSVVERERLQAILDELELGHDGFTTPDSAAKIGKLLGARYMVMGGYFPFMGTLTVHTQVVEVETGEIFAALDVQGAPAEFMRLEREASAFTKNALVSKIRNLPITPGAVVPVPAPAPTAPAPAAPAPAAAKTRDGSSVGSVPAPSAPSIEAPDPAAMEAAVAFSDGLIFLDAGDGSKARESFQKAVAKSKGFDDAKAALAKLDL